MRLLLDTQILLWAFFDLPQLGPRQRRILSSHVGQCWVSVASPWEIEIKRALRKLEAPDDIAAAIGAFGWHLLPIVIAHTRAVGRLAHLHGDPFDRMLVAQAMCEGMTLMTADHRLQAYGIPTLW